MYREVPRWVRVQSWRPGEGCPWTTQNKVTMKRTFWWIGIEVGRGKEVPGC